MGGHVVGPLGGVCITRIELRRDSLEVLFQVMTSARVGVFTDQEAGAGMQAVGDGAQAMQDSPVDLEGAG